MALVVNQPAGLPGNIGGGLGNLNINIVDVTLDSSYPTGGTTVTPAAVGMGNVVLAMLPLTPLNGNFVPFWNTGTGKLQVFTLAAAPAVEVTNATNLSGTVVRFLVIGR